MLDTPERQDDPERPLCVLCRKPFDHGCNTAVCSQACADEIEMIHERQHAGGAGEADDDGIHE